MNEEKKEEVETKEVKSESTGEKPVKVEEKNDGCCGGCH
jgi:hypothetical protein